MNQVINRFWRRLVNKVVKGFTDTGVDEVMGSVNDKLESSVNDKLQEPM